ncbi:hypothetical protein HanRHA438_Chr16g0753441 [Helianthus annuus]|nr:hypothetical protein HanRHA438_Chr16g0753441 [Helianthus annuus]
MSSNTHLVYKTSFYPIPRLMSRYTNIVSDTLGTTSTLELLILGALLYHLNKTYTQSQVST